MDEAIRLAKEELYDQALPLFEQAIASGNDREELGEWAAYYYSKCLTKTGRLSEAVQLNRSVYKRFPGNKPNKNMYVRNLYKLYVKPDKSRKPDEGKLFQVANFIVKVTEQQDPYSPYEATVLGVLKYLKGKENSSGEQLLLWVDKLEPSLLSQEPYVFQDSGGEERELASPLEQWHQNRVNALYSLERWQACIEAVDEALASVRNFHYNNNIWIRMKKALSIANLGNIEEGITQLEQLSKEFGDWNVYHELFNLYQRTGNREKAIEKGAAALVARSGEYKHKLKLLVKLGALLEEAGQEGEALRHYGLARDIREENGWSPVEKLVHRISALEAKWGPLQPGYRKQLERFWTERKLAANPKGIGVVEKLIADGRSGFILTGGEQGQEQERLFFRASDYRGPRHKLAPGLEVTFHITESYDHKRQRASKAAIEIRPA